MSRIGFTVAWLKPGLFKLLLLQINLCVCVFTCVCMYGDTLIIRRNTEESSCSNRAGHLWNGCYISFCVVLFHWGSERGWSTVDQVSSFCLKRGKEEWAEKCLYVTPIFIAVQDYISARSPLENTRKPPSSDTSIKNPGRHREGRQATASLPHTVCLHACYPWREQWFSCFGLLLVFFSSSQCTWCTRKCQL